MALVLDRPLNTIGDKGLFITEIEDAMRAGRVDIAVHSAKDLPSELPEDMVLAALLPRADPRDVLISLHGELLADLPHGAQVGLQAIAIIEGQALVAKKRSSIRRRYATRFAWPATIAFSSVPKIGAVQLAITP